MKPWTDIREWFAEEEAHIRNKYDSITVYTGEEGRGKSYTMLLCHRAKDPTFDVSRVHFDQDSFMSQAATLQPGAAIQLDEFEGHRRMAMHGKRLDFLTFLKERRSLRLRAGIGFPHIQQMDRDILNSRVRYWCHHYARGQIEVKERFAQTKVGRYGEPYVDVKWVTRGRFSIPLATGQLVRDYDRRKQEFTTRNPEPEKGKPRQLFDPDAALPVVNRIKERVSNLPVNQVFLDEVMADIKRAM